MRKSTSTLFLAIALLATSCGVGTSLDAVGSATRPIEAPDFSDDDTNAADNDAADDREAAPASQETEASRYGPEPTYTRVAIDASTPLGRAGNVYGEDIVRTTIEGAYPGDPDHTGIYIALTIDGAGPAVWHSRADDEIKTLCSVELGCASGTIDLINAIIVQEPILSYPDDPFSTRLALIPFFHPAPASEGWYGWEYDGDIEVGDYRGRCFTSVGEWIPFPGDPVEETPFDAGDRMCVIYYENGSSLLATYDFGGDGTLEYELLEVRADWDESELVFQDGATEVPVDQVKFDELVDEFSA